jgi:hypothetical protein
MPLIDLKCEHGHVREAYRPLSMWPQTPPCEACGAATEQIHLPKSSEVRSVDPVVVYQAPDGSMRFPPDITSASTAMYDQKGFTRIELRGFADVRRFERHMNTAELSHVRRRVERQQEQHERAVSERRAEGRRCLEQGFQLPERNEKGELTGRIQTVRLSERGRAIMRAAMERNDRKGGPRAQDPGFHSEAYSFDKSNRSSDPRRRDQ